MSEPDSLPGWWTPIAVLAVCWNILGAMAVAGELMIDESAIQAMEPAIAELYLNTPKWPLVGSVLAVGCGIAGSVGLVMRKRWAQPALIVSIVGLIIQNIHPLFMSDYLTVAGPSAAIMPGVVFGIALLLVRVARLGERKGWIR